MAKRLRTYTAHIEADTIPDFFERRFRDKSHLLMGISALVIVIFFIPYTASGFSACGKLFSSLFGFDYTAAMIVSAAVIIIYTASGGFLGRLHHRLYPVYYYDHRPDCHRLLRRLQCRRL